MLTCVPPFLSQTLVAHTLKNYIKVAITIFLDFTFTILLVTITIFLDVTIIIFLDFTIITITMYI